MSILGGVKSGLSLLGGIANNIASNPYLQGRSSGMMPAEASQYQLQLREYERMMKEQEEARKMAMEQQQKQEAQRRIQQVVLGDVSERPDAYQGPGAAAKLMRYGFDPSAIKTLMPEESKPMSSVGKLMADRMALARQNPNDPMLAQYDAAIQKSTTTDGAGAPGYGLTPFLVQTPNGIKAFQMSNQGGMVEVPIPEGSQPYVGYDKAYDTRLGNQDAIAQTAGNIESQKAQGKASGEAIAGAPEAIASMGQTADLIDQALSHPGLSAAVGRSSIMNPLAANALSGTDRADFLAIQDQLEGKAFLQAFESLKGGGQITEVEGKKATQAIARLNTAQSEAAYKQALSELKEVISAGIDRQKSKTGAAPSGGWRIIE